MSTGDGDEVMNAVESSAVPVRVLKADEDGLARYCIQQRRVKWQRRTTKAFIARETRHIAKHRLGWDCWYWWEFLAIVEMIMIKEIWFIASRRLTQSARSWHEMRR